MKTKKCLHCLQDNEEGFLKLLFIQNNTQLVTASTTGIIVYWDLKTGEKIAHKTLKPSFGELAINENETLMATDTPKSCIHIFKLKPNNQPLQDLSEHKGYIFSLQFLTHYILCSASKDKTIRFWDVPSQNCFKTLHHNNSVSLIRFSKDQLRLYSASEDGVLNCWNIMSEQDKKLFDALKKYVTLPFARLIYLAWKLKKEGNQLDLSNLPSLQNIFNSFQPKGIKHAALQKFLCKHLKIINNTQKNNYTKLKNAYTKKFRTP